MRALLLAAMLALAGVSAAADRQLVISPTAAPPGGEKRLALIIGNSAYSNSPLRNPVNDARAIAKALAGTGFRVTVLEDASQSAMTRAIRQFGEQLAAGGIGLFYYAGHGMQVRGRNFLIPVNADIQHEDEIEFSAVDANFVVAKMDTAKNGLNLLILDACRNNPFQRSFRSGTQGLAQMDAPSGTLVAFATAPGSVAADGDGSNGLYTKHLLANLAKPGLPIEQLFKEVRIGVARETQDRQIPWESSSLRGNFFFVPGEAVLSAEEQRRQVEKMVAERVAVDRAEQQKKMEDTIRQLLARQRAELEAELKRRGEVLAASAPKPPAEAKPPAAPQVASVAPAALIASTSSATSLPKIGDRWEYAYRDGYGRRNRNLRFEITGVSAEGILETGGFAGAAPDARAHSAAASLVFDGYFDFSPYLLAFGVAPNASWNGLHAVRHELCTRVSAVCRFDGRVVGSEKVTTPAGSFDALKVVIDLNGQGISPVGAPSVTTWRQMTFWYSDAVKRVVKSSARTNTGFTIEDDYDLELVSYKLN